MRRRDRRTCERVFLNVGGKVGQEIVPQCHEDVTKDLNLEGFARQMLACPREGQQKSKLISPRTRSLSSSRTLRDSRAQI